MNPLNHLKLYPGLDGVRAALGQRLALMYADRPDLLHAMLRLVRGMAHVGAKTQAVPYVATVEAELSAGGESRVSVDLDSAIVLTHVSAIALSSETSDHTGGVLDYGVRVGIQRSTGSPILGSPNVGVPLGMLHPTAKAPLELPVPVILLPGRSDVVTLYAVETLAGTAAVSIGLHGIRMVGVE